MNQVPWVRTRASAVVMILIFSLCMLLCMTPFMVYGIMFLYFAAPCLMCLAWLLSGRAAADVCAVLSVAGFYLSGGTWAGLAGAVYLLPAHAAFRILTVKKASALKTGIVMAAVMMLSQMALYIAVQALNGGKAYDAAARAVTDWFERDRELGDLMLIYLNSLDILPLSSSFEGQGMVSSGVLTDAARENLLGTLHLTVVNALTAAVPAMTVEMSIYQGALAVLVPRRGAESYLRSRARRGDGEDVLCPLPGEDTPQLRLWHLPRGWGWRIGILGAGYALMYVPNDTAALLGQLLFYVFFAVYSIQGIALLNHIQCKRGGRRIWRIVVPLLILFIFQEALLLMGCADQVLDPRKLREDKDDQETDRWEV